LFAVAALLVGAQAQLLPFENTAVCGDFKCEGQEMFSCPSDCAAEITNQVCDCVVEAGACEQTCEAIFDLGKHCGIYGAAAICGNIIPSDAVYTNFCGACSSSDFSLEGDDLDFSTGNGEDYYYWDSSMGTNQPEDSMGSTSGPSDSDFSMGGDDLDTTDDEDYYWDSSMGTNQPEVSMGSTSGPFDSISDSDDSFGGLDFLDESMDEISVCGDMVCDEDELTTCPQDCVAEITNAMCDCVVAAGACDATCIDIMDLGEKCSAYGALGICGGVIPFDVKYSVYCGGCHNIPSGSSLQPTQVPSESDSTVDFDLTSVPSFTFGSSMEPTTVPTSRVTASLLPTSVPSDSTTVFEPTSVPSLTAGTSMHPTVVPTSRVSASLLPTRVPSDSTADLDPTSVPSFTVGTSMHPTTVPTSRVSASLLPTSVPSDSSVQTTGLNTLTSDFGTPEPSNSAVVFEPTSVPSFSFGSSLRPTSEPSDSSFQTSSVSTSQPSSFDVLTLRDLRQIRRAFKNPPTSALFAQLRVLVDRLVSRNQNLVPAVAATIDDLQKSLGGRYHPRAFRQAKRTFRQLNNLLRATQN